MNSYSVCASRLIVLITLLINTAAWATPLKLRIGVSLHPYYSWVINIVGDKAEVTSIIPAGSDPHSYQPRPEDLERMSKLNVLVSNGLGHDTFVEPMLKAISTEHINLIDPNKNVPLIPVQINSGNASFGSNWNSHSFLSITSSVQQIGNISEALARLDPANGAFYKANAKIYIKRLRRLLANALSQLEPTNSQSIKLATVHDGYSYLFQDLGLTIDAVIQPRHGIDPSTKQLADTINQLKKNQVQILFTEVDYGKKFSEVVAQETDVKIYQLSHISSGTNNEDKFEQDIKLNIQQIIKAIKNHER